MLGTSVIDVSHVAVLSSLTMRIAPGMKEQIVDLAMNNAGIRETARAFHISINAVVLTLKNSRRDV